MLKIVMRVGFILTTIMMRTIITMKGQEEALESDAQTRYTLALVVTIPFTGI